MNEFEYKAFLNNRLHIDCEWQHKNSYWFSEIVCARFPSLLIAYLVEEDRFVAIDEQEKLYYDYEGIHNLDSKEYQYLKLILLEDPSRYMQLMDRFMK